MLLDRLKVVIDAENGFMVLVVEKKCLDDVKYFKYCFLVCSSISDDFKFLEVFSRLCCHTLYIKHALFSCYIEEYADFMPF